MNSSLLRNIRKSYIIISGALTLAGLLLIIFPGVSINIIGIIAGIVMIVFGVVRIAGYFSKESYRIAFRYDFAFGLLLLALGIFILANPSSLADFICIILGIIIFADALFKMQLAFDAKRLAFKAWWLMFAVSFAAGLLGFMLLFYPAEGSKTLAVLIGITFLAEGVLNLCNMLMVYRLAKNAKKDVIDTDFTEL